MADFAYRVEFSSRRKTVGITVERDAEVVVKAPEGLSLERIEEIVQSRQQWLKEKISSPQKYPRPLPKKKFVSGESFAFLGTVYSMHLVKDQAEPLRFSDDFYLAESQKKDALQLFKEWYLKKAKEILIPRVNYFATHIPVSIQKIEVKELATSWGRCSPKGDISLNWRIVKAPMNVIDYILVHELAHLRELNHSPEFWAIIKRLLPNYQRSRDWLEKNGLMLELDFWG